MDRLKSKQAKNKKKKKKNDYIKFKNKIYLLVNK